MSISDKLLKVLGQDTVDEMDALAEPELKAVIVSANEAMEKVEQELEANAEYQRIKELKSDMTAGKRAVDARQKARIKYSLHRLSELGKA